MNIVILLSEFKAWLAGLKDKPTRRRLAARLFKAETGNLGGGDKSTQSADIARAVTLSKTLEY